VATVQSIGDGQAQASAPIVAGFPNQQCFIASLTKPYHGQVEEVYQLLQEACQTLNMEVMGLMKILELALCERGVIMAWRLR